MNPLNLLREPGNALPRCLLAAGVLLCSGVSLAEQGVTNTGQSLWGEKTDVTLGMGVAIVPRYMGADEYRHQWVPTLSLQRGLLFIDSTRGLGLQWQSPSGFSASAALNYDFGRSDKNTSSRPGSNELEGMGSVAGATVADFTLAQQLLPWLSVSAEAELRTAGQKRGNRYRLGVEGIVYHNPRDTVAVDIDAHAGDGRYNQTYFGVSSLQSQRSGFSRFQADGGIYAYSMALNWQHMFDAHWSTVASLGASHYTDQAGASPLVETHLEATGLLALNYSF
ncbi:MipA/OmpV family protein [Pseudomonas sp. COR18]|uniref:MipA/OmpV family protein n=1 Tax=Pseudomonas sp. COR18 TaxID=3399680 RepID=UPI003B0023F2